MAFLGCDERTAILLNDGMPLRKKRSKAMLYLYQRQSSFKRGIAWEITFPEWLSVWLESGKFEQRGVGVGSYCMARHGDAGPYKVGNVSIQTCTQNSRDGIEKARPAIALADTDRTGTGRGWTYRSGSRYTRRPYQVVVASKYVGAFATQHAAEHAYRLAAAIHRGEALS
jgi:hypothetical protein